MKRIEELEKQKKESIALKYRSYALNGRITFAGVLTHYYDEVSEEWKATTSNRYLSDYAMRLLDTLPQNKAISDYSMDDISGALKILRDSEDEKHYIHLLKHVFTVAEERGICPNLFFDNSKGSQFGKIDEAKGKRLASTIKSLSIEKEIRLLNYFNKKADEMSLTGEEIGVFLMMFLGLRNQEAAGVTFGSIKQLGNSRYYGAYIYMKVKDKTHEVVVGGKTSNAFRVIPILNFVLSFIDQRKAFVINEMERTTTEFAIDRMPVACKGDDFEKFCSPGDITEKAKEIFEAVGIGKAVIEEVSNTLKQLLIEGVDIEEDEPRAYLLRRNFGTNLAALGFTPNEIQYLIGHDIESDTDERNYFVNEDRLVRIATLMQDHPYCVYFDSAITRTEVEMEKMSPIESKSQIALTTSESRSEVIISAECNEPMDDITITSNLSKGDILEVFKEYSLKNEGYSFKINTKQQLWDCLKSHTCK